MRDKIHKHNFWAKFTSEMDKAITENTNLIQVHRGNFEHISVTQGMSTNFTHFWTFPHLWILKSMFCYISLEEYGFFWFLSVCIPYGDTKHCILSSAAAKSMGVEGTCQLQSLLFTVPKRAPHLLVFKTAEVTWAGLFDNRSGQRHSGCEVFWSEDAKYISRENLKFLQ